MPISVPCTGCGTVLKVRDTAAGKRAQCSHCGDMIQIPKAEERPPIDDLDDFEDETAASAEVTYKAIPSAGFILADDRRCPACGEEIEPGLPRCRYCSPDLDCSPKKKTLRQLSRSWWNNPREQDLTLEDIALCLVAAPLMVPVGLARKYHGHPTANRILFLSATSLFFYRAAIFAFRVWVLDQKFARF
ncbi:MAG: hypothetical protein JWN70_539 [Planctomycetaceae bacterium]|nr:hypothetical protein [Planctomycetaceae bacterium]